MPQSLLPGSFSPGTLHNRSPPIKVTIRLPVSGFQSLRGQLGRTIDDMARVVAVPVAVQQPSLLGHALIERGAGIRREDVKGGGFDALVDGPLDRSVKDRVIIFIQIGRASCRERV